MGRPKTSCFAYRKVNGQSTCLALTELLCTKVNCPFYKTIPQYEAEAKKIPGKEV